jgi:hypothetical protein
LDGDIVGRGVDRLAGLSDEGRHAKHGAEDGSEEAVRRGEGHTKLPSMSLLRLSTSIDRLHTKLQMLLSWTSHRFVMVLEPLLIEKLIG